MLKVRGLKKSFGDTTVLKGVNLDINEGEITVIVGPSGGGKTTLLRSITGLEKCEEGSIEINGKLFFKDGKYADKKSINDIRKNIGLVFQSFNLIERFSAEENVELPLVYAGVPRRLRREIAKSALDRVGLSHRLLHRPSELSGGQRQRVAIARAITRNPSVILADEPTGNLDREASDAVLQILSELHRGGTTVIVITHDMGVAERADRILKISEGKISYNST